LVGIKDAYRQDIIKFGIRGQVEGLSLKEMTAGLEKMFAEMGRRLNTEAFTGLGLSDALIKKDLFDKAGIEKYYYDGPSDGKTRTSCQSTLSNSKQAEGWSMEEIGASETPFIERGGYNCRHEWLPFIGE
jgi:hypothetical protein